MMGAGASFPSSWRRLRCASRLLLVRSRLQHHAGPPDGRRAHGDTQQNHQSADPTAGEATVVPPLFGHTANSPFRRGVFSTLSLEGLVADRSSSTLLNGFAYAHVDALKRRAWPDVGVWASPQLRYLHALPACSVLFLRESGATLRRNRHADGRGALNFNLVRG